MEAQSKDRRKGEAGPAPFRSGRFFSASGKWFFATREGRDHGPFESRAHAESELQLFLRGMIGVAPEPVETTALLDPWARSNR